MTKYFPIFTVILVLIFLVSCSPSPTPGAMIEIVVNADGKSIPIEVEEKTSVATALEKAGVQLNNLDRVEPESFKLITEPAQIVVVRVIEEFDVEEQVIPFEHQTVQNESIPKGQTLLIQPGSNGSQQITYRRVMEDGVQKSRSIFQVAVVKDPVPEITMVGVQTPFTPLSIPGRISYLIAGNAWVMDGSTGERRPVVTTGDLDGRIFNISLDGRWLLFTRKSPAGGGKINSLYAVDILHEGQSLIDLGVNNVIHHADWVPNQENTFSYSTVEPSDAPPGWQANNDLWIMTFTSSGSVIRNENIIESNSGGTYGWWGTDYSWSPDGNNLAYSRPDEIGLVDQEEGRFSVLQKIIPYDSRSDWAWIPPLEWSPDSQILLILDHSAAEDDTQSGSSPDFDLRAIFPGSSSHVTIAPLSGMFAYPSTSPFQINDRYQIAYLQAIFPARSDTSRYKIVLMDRDGSNKKIVFPPEGSAGMEPQSVIWSPPSEEYQSERLAFLYQGNIWFLDLPSLVSHQVTGDGLISRMDWR